MNDGTPEDVASDAQLDRISRSVLRAIADRRRRRRQVAGTAVAVVLLVGGLGGLLRLAVGSESSASSAGSAAESTASGTVAVACATGPNSRDRRVRVPEAQLPDAAIAACGVTVDFQSSSGQMPTAAPAPSFGSPSSGAPSSSSPSSSSPSSGAPSSSSPSYGAPSSGGSSGALTSGGYSPSPSLATAAVLCRSPGGTLIVLPLTGSAAATCARAGLHVWRPPS